MKISFHNSIVPAFFFFGLLLFVLIWNRTLPFVQLNSFQNMCWEAGFAQSIANHSLFYPYALDFGIPAPMPVPFGLSIIWPMAFLIGGGMFPPAAFSLVNAICLGIAFCGGYKLARRFGLSSIQASLAAACWLAQYAIMFTSFLFGALGLGLALFPYYTLIALNYFSLKKFAWKTFALYFFTIGFACFLDGYTFVMFAVLSTGIGIQAVWSGWRGRNRLIWRLFFLHLLFFAFFAAAYKLYAGNLPLGEGNLSEIATSGVDFKLWLWPTRNISAVFDLFNISLERPNPSELWGAGASQHLWCLPILIAGLLSIIGMHKKPLFWALAVVGIFTFWLSLGPVLRFGFPPTGGQPWRLNLEYPGLIFTGNSFLYNFPVFKSMRYPVRWIVLTAFILYMFILMRIGQNQKKWVGIVTLTIIFVFNIAPLDHPRAGKKDYVNAIRMEKELLPLLRMAMGKEEKVAVIPFDDEFGIVYLSSRTPFLTFAAAPDKNKVLAQYSWPASLRQAKLNKLYEAAHDLLGHNYADVIMLPKFNLGWRVTWPPREWHADYNKNLEPLRVMAQKGCITLEQGEFFSLARAASDIHSEKCSPGKNANKKESSEKILRKALNLTGLNWIFVQDFLPEDGEENNKLNLNAPIDNAWLRFGEM